MNGQDTELILSEYDISRERGFIPTAAPLVRLSAKCFQSWEDIASDLASLVQGGKLREKIHSLSVTDFSSATLMSEEEWKRAYVLLTFLSQAYIWAEGEKGIPDKLPGTLAVPWVSVANHLGVPPVITYAATVLWNWRVVNPALPMEDVDNLVAVANFTGTDDESWFYMVAVGVELAAVPGILAVVESLKAMADSDHRRLVQCLTGIADCLDNMKHALNRMYERCDPRAFYVEIRPFQAGTKGLDAFPEGLIYEGSSVKCKFSGASAAQSSSIPTFDIFLGVEHTGSDAEFLAEMRLHMPPKHRAFLELLRHQPSVRDYVMHSNDVQLVAAYNKAVTAFGNLRSDHVTLVTRYIVLQKQHTVNVALETKGTGGTDFMVFLKKVRDDTQSLKIEL